MSQELIKLIIAFFVGLVPFILKIVFDNISYKRSQVDKFGSLLFEKQLILFHELNQLLTEYQNNLAHVVVAGSYGKSVSNSLFNWYKELKEDNSFNLYQDQKKRIESLIDGNTILIPDFLLTLLHSYIEYSELLYNSWLKCIFEKLPEDGFTYPENKLINNKEDLIEFNKNLIQKHFNITCVLKMYVGTEQLKKYIIQYTNNKLNIPQNVQRIKKANI